MESRFYGQRKCKVHCSNCFNRFGIDREDMYEYEAIVHSSDVELKYHPILNKYIPMTKCKNCNSWSARITKIEAIKDDEPLLDKLKLTKQQFEQKRENILEDYAKNVGIDQAKKDFLQPFDETGKKSEEFEHIYGKDNVQPDGQDGDDLQ